MKSYLLLLLILPLLTACPAGVIPSIKYCDEVNYHREGTKVKVDASCTVPTTGGLF